MSEFHQSTLLPKDHRSLRRVNTTVIYFLSQESYTRLVTQSYYIYIRHQILLPLIH